MCQSVQPVLESGCRPGSMRQADLRHCRDGYLRRFGPQGEIPMRLVHRETGVLPVFLDDSRAGCPFHQRCSCGCHTFRVNSRFDRKQPKPHT